MLFTHSHGILLKSTLRVLFDFDLTTLKVLLFLAQIFTFLSILILVFKHKLLVSLCSLTVSQLIHKYIFTSVIVQYRVSTEYYTDTDKNYFVFSYFDKHLLPFYFPTLRLRAFPVCLAEA